MSASISTPSNWSGNRTWTYDNKDQLTNETSTQWTSGWNHTNAFDTAGNPTTFKNNARTYNANNQLVTPGANVYDGNGNPTTYNGTTVAYDVENRVTAYGSLLTNGYRADGLRAWKQKADGTRTYFLYDGGNPIIEMDSAGNTANLNVFAPDGLIARKEGSTWTYYTFDAQGNVVHKLNSSNQPTAARLLDAWGAGVETTLPRNIDPWGYNAKWGYYYDRETSLYYCQNRMYDASTGRWLNRDPIGTSGGINLYGYCENGAVGSADPWGLQKRNVGGDTSGDAGWGWLLPDYWGSENGVTKKGLMDILEKSEGATFWGHGAKGKASYNGSESFGVPQLREAARRRRAAGRDKMKYLAIDQCMVLSDPEFINAALELADEVRGFTDWTIDPHNGYRIGKKKTYTNPVPRTPSMPGPNYEPKKGKSGKDKNLPESKEKKRGS